MSLFCEKGERGYRRREKVFLRGKELVEEGAGGGKTWLKELEEGVV